MARRKPSSSSASAGMIVSGTYWPPYGPKRPALADSSNVMLFDCLQECTDEAGAWWPDSGRCRTPHPGGAGPASAGVGPTNPPTADRATDRLRSPRMPGGASWGERKGLLPDQNPKPGGDAPEGSAPRPSAAV